MARTLVAVLSPPARWKQNSGSREKIAKLKKPPLTKLALTNRYEALSDESDEETPSPPEEKPKKCVKPTPVVMHGVAANQKELIEAFSDVAKNKFYLRKSANTTSVFFTNADDNQVFIQMLLRDKTSFNTYTEKATKTHGFVIRGLSHDIEPEDILTNIKSNYNVNVLRCFKMKTSGPALFLLVTDTKTLPKKRIIQCHRCQQWGHASSNCYGEIKCLKCAGTHLTQECTKSPDTAAKCANCQGGDVGALGPGLPGDLGLPPHATWHQETAATGADHAAPRRPCP